MTPPMGAISQAGNVVPNSINASNATNATNVSIASNAVSAGPERVAGSTGATGEGSASNAANNNRVQQTQVDGQAYSTVNQILNRTVSDSSLVWGRWGAANPQDNLTIAFKDAMQNRAVTVGDGYAFLFRQENNVPNLLSVQQGNVNFALQSSYAYFLDLGNNVNTAKVNSGTLGVNFSTLDVKTTLNLTAQTVPSSVLGSGITPGATLSETLTATAKLNATTGIFLLSPVTAAAMPSSVAVTPTTPTMAGALSLDTKQAGYLFSLPTGNGAFKGATLWGR